MEYLSDEWLEELARVGAELPAVDGIDLIIQHEIAGAPSGKVRYYTVLKDGQYAEVAKGKHKEAEVQVSAKAEAALRILNGDMSPDVGFMQGRLKVDGAYKQLLVDYRPFRESEPYQALWAHMAQLTT